MKEGPEPNVTPKSPTEEGDTSSKWTTEDGAICGSSITLQLPPGTVVEFPEEGGIRVVEQPEE